MKRLVFCFDGTWNRLDATDPTNVVLTAESVNPTASNGISQVIYYHEGVGTDRWERIRGGAFGAGLLNNIADAYRSLVFNYKPGDEIYIFGFSRGAYTARSFAGLLRTCGIVRRRDAALTGRAIELYENRIYGLDGFAAIRQELGEHFSPDVCISDADNQWRSANVSGYSSSKVPILTIKYLGVWDTVGALGIPSGMSLSGLINRKHQFHDTDLGKHVENARHAVAIDERRASFEPALWTNLDELNEARGFNSADENAPYQQRWFPGTHGSVGGGGALRGLSDQTLDWIWDGARDAGLELDTTHSSRIYELLPSHNAAIENSSPPSDPSPIDKAGAWLKKVTRKRSILPERDRHPGPKALHEISISTKRRWFESADVHADGKLYRPGTLEQLRKQLEGMDPGSVGVGFRPEHLKGDFAIHIVKPGESLSSIALLTLGDAKMYRLLYEVNSDKISDPDKIFAGQALRIPPKDFRLPFS